MAQRRKKTSHIEGRLFDARPDSADFRDRLYTPGLHEVPPVQPLANYQRHRVPILDQGNEGACTGFGLATVANFLLRTRDVKPEKSGSVSPRMMYEMAKRYDPWPGHDYEGSSCRGAMKGWQKHGVCQESLWKHSGKVKHTLTNVRKRNAAARPLGAYYRVNTGNLSDMHAALSEVGVLYVSSDVHSGWDDVKSNGGIPSRKKILGGHAYALVGFDEVGFWLQNSWGPDWGKGGFGRLSYEDWLRDGADAWVCRLGVPVTVKRK
ncbi:C1 family peptidase [bacterium]|nr:C1 family peptidase [bacterium]